MKNLKILVVCLNPCIDALYEVDDFAHGGLNRVSVTRRDAAGKGVNVAIALANLGVRVVCTGFNFCENGELLRRKLDESKVAYDFVDVSGEVRTNIKLYEKSTGAMTELNQPGSFVPFHAQAELLEKIRRHNADVLVLSGSRPENVEADFYAKIVAQEHGKFILDMEGDALLLALDAAGASIQNVYDTSGIVAHKKIFAVKPNLFELESTFGVKFSSPVQPKEIIDFCRASHVARPSPSASATSNGRRVALATAQNICVSMGAGGAVLITGEDAYYSPALSVQAKGVAGAGDAMVAGLVFALAMGSPVEDYLPAAMAAAAASVMRDGTLMCTREEFDRFFSEAREVCCCLQG